MKTNLLFPNHFYWHFKAPNAEELISALNKETADIDNSQFDWSDLCDVDKIPLSWDDYIDLITPSLNHISGNLSKTFQTNICNPWINLYKPGQFQEMHDHPGYDLVCVFFVNSGENFSKFYFADRNAITIPVSMVHLLDLKSYQYVDYEAGDILFFPAQMMHGVTKHKSKIIRKSFSCNLKLIPQLP
tara:strand:- start:38 stop:598 length:561 start_codon:yes stop_codon:yes gene_type:complete